MYYFGVICLYSQDGCHREFLGLRPICCCRQDGKDMPFWHIPLVTVVFCCCNYLRHSSMVQRVQVQLSMCCSLFYCSVASFSRRSLIPLSTFVSPCRSCVAPLRSPCLHALLYKPSGKEQKAPPKQPQQVPPPPAGTLKPKAVAAAVTVSFNDMVVEAFKSAELSSTAVAGGLSSGDVQNWIMQK